MSIETTISSRFNGPPTSGNGGYSCGVIAAHISGPARVRLMQPPPLDKPLHIGVEEAGKVVLLDGETPIGSGTPCAIDRDFPPAPTLEQATSASEGFPCYHEHVFGTCFVCGPHRPAHDGLDLFPGPVDDWHLIACPWRLRSDLLDSDGNVREEILWSALDCPGYFAAMGGELRHAVLGQLDGEIIEPVSGSEELVVYAWPLGQEGRKYFAGTAVARGDGTVVAHSRSVWIELRQ
ncbi:hypothetical protein EY643_09590 [Halioglobus maricola]|uniref:Uncharacterized protein n=1 Tax=Halioglobus maricola TaxID=2601894 RepID=A0A5P9NJ49_9GAMM|nr:hypothetical protein [Halioglobus maricola]QFU75893.1 hypothetical protein EY643_09590 [Halioglobus maricola]